MNRFNRCPLCGALTQAPAALCANCGHVFTGALAPPRPAGDLERLLLVVRSMPRWTWLLVAAFAACLAWQAFCPASPEVGPASPPPVEARELVPAVDKQGRPIIFVTGAPNGAFEPGTVQGQWPPHAPEPWPPRR